MPRTSRQDAPTVAEAGSYAARVGELGGYTVAFETHSADQDYAPLFRGLPDDRCPCPHWGVVLKGEIIYRYADHDEVFREGDAYHAPPSHLPKVTAGTELIEFSPTAQLRETLAVVEKNARAAG